METELARFDRVEGESWLQAARKVMSGLGAEYQFVGVMEGGVRVLGTVENLPLEAPTKMALLKKRHVYTVVGFDAASGASLVWTPGEAAFSGAMVEVYSSPDWVGAAYAWIRDFGVDGAKFLIGVVEGVRTFGPPESPWTWQAFLEIRAAELERAASGRRSSVV